MIYYPMAATLVSLVASAMTPILMWFESAFTIGALM